MLLNGYSFRVPHGSQFKKNFIDFPAVFRLRDEFHLPLGAISWAMELALAAASCIDTPTSDYLVRFSSQEPG